MSKPLDSGVQPIEDRQDDITQRLGDWCRGRADALEGLLPLVYEDLKAIATYHFRKENPGHTLQVTALVHEAYLQLLGSQNISFENRSQFFLYVGQIMRHLLVAHARRSHAQKRGGHQEPLWLDEGIMLSDEQTLDLETLLALDEALKQLTRVDARQVRIVEMRFFCGLNHGEIAETLGVSIPTVKREWSAARCWLSFHLNQQR